MNNFYLSALDCTREVTYYDNKNYSQMQYSQRSVFAYNNINILTITSPHLPITPVQLKRPGIGRNASCAVGDFA